MDDFFMIFKKAGAGGSQAGGWGVGARESVGGPGAGGDQAGSGVRGGLRRAFACWEEFLGTP